VAVPEALARLLARPTECIEIDASLDALRGGAGMKKERVGLRGRTVEVLQELPPTTWALVGAALVLGLGFVVAVALVSRARRAHKALVAAVTAAGLRVAR